MRAGIALGSNLGDRKSNLLLAIEELKKIHQAEIFHKSQQMADERLGPSPLSSFLSSSIHETEPHDCQPDSPYFLNAVIELETTLSPDELLKQLQAIEVAFGRPAEHSYHAPRTLDLDLLYQDDMTKSTSNLELPHPRIRERLFVLAPLVEISPDIMLPGWSKTAKEYLLLLQN